MLRRLAAASAKALSPIDEGRNTRLLVPRSGALASSPPCAGSDGSSSSSSVSWARLRIRCARRRQKAGQVPAGWRMWKTLVLMSLVSGARTNQVEP